jgi:hypothetical protein
MASVQGHADIAGRLSSDATRIAELLEAHEEETI